MKDRNFTAPNLGKAKLYSVFIGGLVGCALPFIAGTAIFPETRSYLITWAVIILSASGIVCLVYAKKKISDLTIKMTSQGIAFSDNALLRKSIFFNWKEIASVRFSARINTMKVTAGAYCYVVFALRNGKEYSLPRYFGKDFEVSLAEMCKKHSIQYASSVK